MADINSSLPIRTENDGDVVVKLVDGSTPTQKLAVDASGNAQTIVNNGAGAAAVNIQDGGNSITVDGTVTTIQGTSPWTTSVNNLPATVDTNYGAVGSSTLRTAAEIGNSSGAADFNNGATGAQTLRVAANLAVAGANVTSLNPVPVNVVSTNNGTEVNDYNTSAALAPNTPSNHDYAITSSKTFKGRKFWASASGKLKIEVQISADGTTFVTKWVGFNSTANPNISIDLDNLTVSESGTGAKIRIIRTNEDKAAMDVYSTISGNEF